MIGVTTTPARPVVVESPLEETRWVSLDIGPFEDQNELLQFALLLEQAPGVGQLDLLDADPETALFAVRYRSAAELATALTRLPDYHIKPIALANMVSAQIEDPRRAAFLLLPTAAAAGGGWWSTRWWPRFAGAVGAVAAAAGIFYLAVAGAPSFTSAPARTSTPAVVASVPSAQPSAAPAAPSPVASATVAAPAVPSATPATPTAAPPVPSATPSPTASPTATPTPIPTPIPVQVANYGGRFTTSLGIVQAANGCRWNVNLSGDLVLALTPGSGGLSGPATMNGEITYIVAETPAGATCNPATAPVSASGSASGSGTINATLEGERGLNMNLAVTEQNGSLGGNLSLERTINTNSTFGNTSEVRTGTVPTISLARID